MSSVGASAQHNIVVNTAPMPWVALASGAAISVYVIWLGMFGNAGVLEGFGRAGRILAVATGSVGVLFLVLLLVHRITQGRSVMVGDSGGIHVRYPLGLHRFMSGTSLTGDLADARLTTTRIPASGWLRPEDVQSFVVASGERSISVSLTVGSSNDDYEKRFDEWQEWYRDHV